MAVNLLAALDDERFGPAALSRAHAEAAGAPALIPALAGEGLIAMYVRRTGAIAVDEFGYDTGRFRATILASGAGTNARNVLERARDGALPLDIAAIVANDPHAGALEV